MKRFFQKVFSAETRNRLREYWRTLMRSNKRKMSEGAQEINRLITTAHKDQWRRNHDHNKKGGS